MAKAKEKKQTYPYVFGNRTRPNESDTSCRTFQTADRKKITKFFKPIMDKSRTDAEKLKRSKTANELKTTGSL